MKGIKEQTHYEILEVNPAATMKEIQSAYEHAKETFRSDSLAVYSLFSEGEINEIQAAIEEAYRVLIDEGLRKRYDQSHFQTTEGESWKNLLRYRGFPGKEKALSLLQNFQSMQERKSIGGRP